VYYGHNSWVAIVVLVAMVVVRMLSSRRRRGGRPRDYRPGAPGFAAPAPAPARTGPSGSVGPTPSSFTGTVPGWFVDPFARHEQRYWSGTGWTEHVLDGGTPTLDPPPPPRRPAD
jgi:hypothetical protein